jgi:hypothetical protein
MGLSYPEFVWWIAKTVTANILTVRAQAKA